MRFKVMLDGEWCQPRMRGYRMKCCGCGLIHRIDFKVMRLIKNVRGYKTGEPAKGYYVRFRARREC